MKSLLLPLFFLFIGFLAEFTSLGEWYLLRDLNYSIIDIQKIGFCTNAAWATRFIYGYIIDRTKQTNQLIVSTILFMIISMFWVYLIHIQDSVGLIIVLCFIELAPSLGMTLGDAIMVKNSKTLLDLPIYCQRAKIIGKSIGSLLGGVLLGESLRYSLVFTVQGLVCILAGFTMMYMIGWEDPNDEGDQKTTSSSNPPQEGGNSETTKLDMIIFGAFLFFVSALPTAESSVFFYISNSFTPTQIGVGNYVGYICSFLGSFLVAKQGKLHVIMIAYSMANTIALLGTYSIIRDPTNIILLLEVYGFRSLIESSLSTTFMYHLSKYITKGSEGFTTSLYITIPTIGIPFTFYSSIKLTEYFHIDHDNFQGLLAFQEYVIFLSLTPYLLGVSQFFIRAWYHGEND